MSKLNKFYSTSLWSIFFVIACLVAGILINQFSDFKFNVVSIIPISLALVILYHITVNASKIFRKRSLGISLKELLFFYACLATCAILILAIPLLKENWQISVLSGFCISLLATMGVVNLLAMRKKQELEFLGLIFIGKYDIGRTFAEGDEDFIDGLINKRKVWKLSFFLDTYLFTSSMNEHVVTEVKQALNRMEVNPAWQEKSLFENNFPDF